MYIGGKGPSRLASLSADPHSTQLDVSIMLLMCIKPTVSVESRDMGKQCDDHRDPGKVTQTKGCILHV